MKTYCPFWAMSKDDTRTDEYTECGHLCALYDVRFKQCSIVSIMEALQCLADADTTEPSNTEEADADRLDATGGPDSGGETH